ncbi:hypothetical protein SLE2022_285470 [Rubroshorea leprosula]
MESSYISSDVFFEILSRASLQTLGRGRLLSKECNSLTYGSKFMQLHCQRTGTLSGFFIQSFVRNKHISTFVSSDNPHASRLINLDFLPHPVKIEACAKQGIMLCTSQYPQQTEYYICKPTTKQWQVLPNPNPHYFTERIAIMVVASNPLRYKIVRFSKSDYYPKFHDSSPYNLHSEISDSENWTWKQSKDVNLPFYELLDFKPAISVSGALHWKTNSSKIFSFDVEKQSWELISLPKPLCQTECCELVEYEGKMGLICLKKGHYMELWVREGHSHRRKVWSKRHGMDMEGFEREEPLCWVEAFYNADIAVIRGFCKVIFYNCRNGDSDAVRVEKMFGNYHLFLYQSDWEPVNLMGKEHSRTLSQNRY